MHLIATYAHSTRASALKRLQTWVLCGAVALAGLLGAGQAWAASSPPFVDNGDGTVTDASTGLMWDQCTWGQTSASGGCTGDGTKIGPGLPGALTNTLHRGYSDWRRPSMAELQGLIMPGDPYPAIDTAAFPGTPPDLQAPYWTTNVNVAMLEYRWTVHFPYGGLVSHHTSESNYLRLVRNGQCIHPFSILPVTVTAVGPTTAAFTATNSFAATGYWVVVARNAQIPVPPQIKAGTTYAGVAVVASGSVAMGAGSPASVAVTGLALGSQYDLYLWPEKAGSTTPGCIAMQPFATTAISTSAIVIDPATPTTLYAGLDGAGVYKSSNSGSNWTAATTQPANLRVKALVIKPGAPATHFAATYGGGVFQSSDSGVNWAACATQPGNLNLLSLMMDAAGKLYAGSEAGVFVSSDGCASWTALNTGMP